MARGTPQAQASSSSPANGKSEAGVVKNFLSKLPTSPDAGSSAVQESSMLEKSAGPDPKGKARMNYPDYISEKSNTDSTGNTVCL